VSDISEGGSVQPPYLLGGTLYEPVSGHPAWTGPNGEGGYGGPQPNTDVWQMPDGRYAYFFPDENINPGNQVTLGLLPNLPGATPLEYLYLYAQLAPLGGTVAQIQTAIAIITAESGGIWSFHDQSIPAYDRIGLAGIDLIRYGQFTGTNLYNIAANLSAMALISSTFEDFSMFPTYVSGQYLNYLPQATGPVGPEGPVGETPPAGSGPIRTLLDDAVGAVLGGISVLGWHPADSIESIFDPIADTLDGWIDTAYRSVLNVIDWVNNEISSLARYAEGLIDDAVHDAEAFASFLIGLGEGAWRDAVSAVSSAWQAGVAAVDAAWRAALAAAEATLNYGISLIDAAWQAAVSAAEATFNAGLSLVEAAWQAGVSEAETIAADGLDLVEAAWQAGVTEAETLASDAISAVDTAWRDGVAVITGAFNAFVSDIFDPLANEFNNLFGSALSAGSLAIGLIIEVADWVAELAKISYADATAWGQALPGVAELDYATVGGNVIAGFQTGLSFT